MKKVLAVILCLSFIFCLCSCGEFGGQLNNASNELSPKEAYDKALLLIDEENYDEAVELLKNNNYEKTQELFKKVSYIYACELFNKQEFSLAYKNYENSDDLLDSKIKMTEAAYYQGVKMVNNKQQGKSIDWFRKTLSNSQFASLSQEHIKTITTSLISSGWIGTYSNDGMSAQIEFKYFKSNGNLYIGYADVSNGYKFISSLTGPFRIGAEESVFSPKELNESMEFEISFETNRRMYIYSSNETTYELVGGFYSSEGASCLYEIPNVKYPVINIPKIDENGNLINVNNDIPINDTSSTVSQDDTTKPTSSNNNQTSNPTTSHLHLYSQATCTKPATCSCGLTYGSVIDHRWKDATCTKPKTCSTCGATEGSALNHSWGAATCTKAASCSCGAINGSALGHLYETASGIVCVRCKEISSNALEKLNNITWDLPTGGNKVVSVESVSVADCEYYGGSKVNIALGIKVKINHTFNGAAIDCYAYDKANNQISYGQTTAGGSQGREYTVPLWLEIPVSADLAKIKIVT